MGMTCGYGPARDRDAMISLIHRAVDLGVNFFDTAECYGPFANEELLGEALQPIRHNVFVATKFGLKSIGGRLVPDSRPESIRQSVEDSLRRLRTDHVDLLFQHRVDPRVPIEEVAETVGQLVQEGKVCHWGLSEASLNTIRRAHHLLPLTAVENEYSPLWRDAERGLLALLDELGIGLGDVAYIGDDLNDLRLLRAVGYPASPANTPDYVKREVAYVCRASGGQGAFREFVEHLLSRAGLLEEAIEAVG